MLGRRRGRRLSRRVISGGGGVPDNGDTEREIEKLNVKVCC